MGVPTTSPVVELRIETELLAQTTRRPEPNDPGLKLIDSSSSISTSQGPSNGPSQRRSPERAKRQPVLSSPNQSPQPSPGRGPYPTTVPETRSLVTITPLTNEDCVSPSRETQPGQPDAHGPSASGGNEAIVLAPLGRPSEASNARSASRPGARRNKAGHNRDDEGRPPPIGGACGRLRHCSCVRLRRHHWRLR